MQPARASLVLVPLALLLASAASAQTPVRLGQTVSGRLNASSKKAPEDQSYYDLYTYAGRRGERIRVTLRSDDFDAYLNVGRMSGGSFESLDTDDDGAGGSDSQIELTLPADGTYGIRANTLNAGDTGAYTMVVERGAPPVPVTTQPIRTGQTVSGTLGTGDPKLGDNSFYDLYTFTARAGEGVTATLRSPHFDSFLVLGRMRGDEFEEIESDDDSGGGNDARVGATLSEAGTYTLRVNTLYGNQTGSYRLELASGVAPGSEDDDKPASGAGSTVHPQARPIRAGQTVSGTLTERDPVTFDGTYFQDWVFSGKQGDRIVITLRSNAFDSYLQFGRREGNSFSYINAEDDGAGGNDSLLATTLPADGDFVLRVNTLHKSTGAYSLTLEKLPGR